MNKDYIYEISMQKAKIKLLENCVWSHLDTFHKRITDLEKTVFNNNIPPRSTLPYEPEDKIITVNGLKYKLME